MIYLSALLISAAAYADTQSWNAKVLYEAQAFAMYHGGAIGALVVGYSDMGAVQTIDVKTRDGLSSHCIDYAYRLTCECVDQQTGETRKVEFRSAYGGIEKRVD